MLGAAFVYARGVRVLREPWPASRTLLFSAGLVAILLALVSAIDFYAHDLFSIHMTQHMLLTVVAAPLLLLGQPITPLLRGIPASIRRAVLVPLGKSLVLRTLVDVLRAPLMAAALYVGGLYFWHVPAMYDAALEDPLIHAIEHGWMLATALLFWSTVIDPAPFRARLSYAPRIVYLLLAGAAQNTILGGLLSFSSRVFYPYYLGRPEQYGVDALTDQRIGGAVMWVPGDLIFLAAASLCFFLFLKTEEEEQLAREGRR